MPVAAQPSKPTHTYVLCPGAANVSPGAVELQGSLRALSAATFARLRMRVEEVVNASAAAAGAEARDWAWSPTPYPVLVNDEALARLVAQVGQRLALAAGGASHRQGGGDKGRAGGIGQAVRFVPMPDPVLAAEDFAMYAEPNGSQGGIPACFTLMAMTPDATPDGAEPPGLHTPLFDVEEGRLALGAALHASLALRTLQEATSNGSAHDEL